MGKKTGKWLRNFLQGKKEKEKSAVVQSCVDIPATPTKERKRWSFRRSSESPNSTDPSSSQHPIPSGEEQKKHVMAMAAATAAAAAADAAVAAAQAAAVVYRLTNPTAAQQCRERETEDDAAVKIQSVFRSYLARKALRALRGLVKLQAMVRGHLTRKRATNTLRCIQALVNAQGRARAQRGRRSIMEMEESEKIVEMDYGSKSGKRNGSPSPSTRNELSSGVYFGNQEEYSYNTAQSSPQCYSVTSMFVPSRVPYSLSHEYPLYPNYMANTESSRAKVRSHSAPKQRPESFERQLSRRRASVELRNVPKPVRSNKSSQGHDFNDLWSIKLDSSLMSLVGSECGSSSTMLTNTNYCKSLVGFDAAYLRHP